MSAKLKAAVLGVTGYSGFELARILLRHPHLDTPLLLSRSGEKDSLAKNGSGNLADMFPVLSGNGGYPLHTFSWDVLKQHGVELLFLALAPLLKAGVIDRERGIISDSKSGVSGAGKEPSSRTHFVSVADNLSAYSVFEHRHVGEILEQLNLDSRELIFTPHLLPIPRGILSTIYVHLNHEMTPSQVESCFRDFYGGQRWVRVFATPQLPQIQFSLHTNYCDLGFCLDDDGRR